MHLFAGTQRGVDLGLGLGGQQFLDLARFHHQQPGIGIRQRRQSGVLADPAQQPVIEIVAA